MTPAPKSLVKVPLVEYHPQNLTSSGFEISSLQSLRARCPTLDHNPELPHRIKFNMMIYVQQGTGAHFIDFNHYTFSAGSFIFINKGQANAFDFSDRLEGFIIIFTDDFKDSIRSNIRLPSFLSTYSEAFQTPVLTVNESLKGSAELLLGEIEDVVGDEAYDSLVAQLLFSTLLLKLHREMPPLYFSEITEARAAKFLKFLSLVQQQFVSNKEASKYAALMGMTYKSLNQLCKAAVNQTPKQLINAHVILEAKRRLAIEDIQVKQLAFELGFDEVSNFTKYFKAQTLMTPLKFKKNH